MKLSIIIPTYNEIQTIKEVINRVKRVNLINNIQKEIIIVDDASVDGTSDFLRTIIPDQQVQVFFHKNNLGKTAGITTGLKHATGNMLIIQDADLEYSPDTYNFLLKPMLESGHSVVYGSRFKGKIQDMKLINRASNMFSNFSFNILFGTKLTDINTCYKLFKQAAIQPIQIKSQRFGFETEITAKLIKNGNKITEIPIEYIARSKRDGKKINWKFAIEMYWGIFKYRF